MESSGDTVQGFFEQFEAHSTKGEFEAAASMFAETFVAAGPDGSQAVRARDFALALPKRRKRFEEMGCRRSTLLSVTAKKLDSRFTLAETRWQMEFGPGPVEVSSSFLLDTGEKDWKIVLYLTHQDLMATLKEQGILERGIL